MLHTIVRVAAGVPFFSFYAAVIFLGLVCWLVIWGRDRRSDSRSRDLPPDRQ